MQTTDDFEPRRGRACPPGCGCGRHNRWCSDRFWDKVSKTDSCWVWQGQAVSNGYGVAYFGGKKQVAHRIAYQLAVGPISDGMQIDHRCFNPLCVRPDHLR